MTDTPSRRQRNRGQKSREMSPKKPEARIFTDQVNVSLSEDKHVLTLNLGGEHDLKVALPTSQVEKFMETLRQWRSQMKPDIPDEFALGSRVTAILNPPWCTEPESSQGDSLLHIRHPGYGWLSFLIPTLEAAKLAGFLQSQVAEHLARQPPPQDPA